jgi:hypothetical protein
MPEAIHNANRACVMGVTHTVAAGHYAVAHRRNDLRVRMAEHRTHLARGEVQHAPAARS